MTQSFRLSPHRRLDLLLLLALAWGPAACDLPGRAGSLAVLKSRNRPSKADRLKPA